MATTIAAVFASSAWAQWVGGNGSGNAAVPFLVNVDATIRAEKTWLDGCPALSAEPITVTANQADTMHFSIWPCLGVQYGAQRQTSVPAIVSNRSGKVTVNLQAQSYKNAEISLYTVNGKLILRNKVSASGAVNSISRPNVATGVYLLSVRGMDGYAVASRLTHGGGGLNINAVFGNGSENLSVVPQMTKKAADDTSWWWVRITVSASVAGYKDSVYTLLLVDGEDSALQNITLREESSEEPIVIGNKR
ncbi:MAG: T9SS type A sorting domain-containing protein [Chitinispirillales bacterium]|nr:T9SS type A sorting domain-containing protein [Chitinispirillales bacterium]